MRSGCVQQKSKVQAEGASRRATGPHKGTAGAGPKKLCELVAGDARSDVAHVDRARLMLGFRSEGGHHMMVDPVFIANYCGCRRCGISGCISGGICRSIGTHPEHLRWMVELARRTIFAIASLDIKRAVWLPRPDWMQAASKRIPSPWWRWRVSPPIASVITCVPCSQSTIMHHEQVHDKPAARASAQIMYEGAHRG